MIYGGSDYDADELNKLHRKYQFGDKIINEEIFLSKLVSPVICYNHIDLRGGDYSFNQSSFREDCHYYFEKMKLLCESSINLLSNNDTSRDWHLYPTRGKNIVNEMKKLFDMGNIDITPEVYHFALYTDSDKANKSTGKRSPRIHFIVGAHGMLYPIFYDPYHEINP